MELVIFQLTNINQSQLKVCRGRISVADAGLTFRELAIFSSAINRTPRGGRGMGQRGDVHPGNFSIFPK